MLGGIRFVGVNGAPDRPWKLDKNNYQFRVGTAYSLNEKTVIRAGYGKYFLNPTSQGNNAGFSLTTPIISSNDGGRTPTYSLSNPWPNGIQDPPGSSLGPETFLGRNPSFSNPDFVVPNVHQFSAGVQRQLPGNISLEMTYAGSRSYDLEVGYNGYNEPSAAFQAQCDVTLGGSRSYCDELLPNPFFGVAGFEGTTRFTNATLSRYELSRPFPAFSGCNPGTTTNCFSQNQNNIGKLIYDSAQFVLNKRFVKGLTVNASYTYVPRWTEIGGYVDAVSGLLNEGPYFSQRKHRVTASGVWEVPWLRNQKSIAGYVLGGWTVSPLLVFQSGQPWDMPGNVDLAPGVDLKQIALEGKKEGQFIYGVKPCVGQRNATTGQYTLLALSTAYGCTEPYFLIREILPAPHRDESLRRVPTPVAVAGGCELRQDDADYGLHAASDPSRSVQPLQHAAVRRAPVRAEHRERGLRPHQPEHASPVELPAVHPAWIPADLLTRHGPGRHQPFRATLFPWLPPSFRSGSRCSRFSLLSS